MTEWKLRQTLYHRTCMPDDSIETKACVVSTDVLNNIKKYFTTEVEQLIYPSKSYAVALIYSLLLEKYFGVPFMECLDDPSLLYNNDRFFVRYSDDQETYDAAIAFLKENDLLDVEVSNFSQVQTTVRYFYEELMLSH